MRILKKINKKFRNISKKHFSEKDRDPSEVHFYQGQREAFETCIKIIKKEKNHSEYKQAYNELIESGVIDAKVIP